MSKPKKKIKSFNTSELKKNILGDWISILNFPLIIFFYYLWFNQDKVINDTSDFIYVALILPATLGLFCYLGILKNTNFLNLDPHFGLFYLVYLVDIS